jgi:benzodiazapine receptor
VLYNRRDFFPEVLGGEAVNLNATAEFIIYLLACFVAAGIGSLFTFKSIPTWYAGLKKPAYTPPNQAFGPIWTILYILMSVSVFLVWQRGLSTSSALLAFSLFWVQLAFNALWSIVFFGLKSKGGGFFVIIVLWFLILATLIASFRVSTWAGVLLIPYLLWVSIATYLNIGVWRLNTASKTA